MTEVSPQSEPLSGLQFLGLVSVVITCYNQACFLSEAIESVLCQTYRALEIIVIDDGSTDDTPKVACRYPEARYFRQSNQGLSAARNRGIKEGRGDFFLFLDADDRLLPLALEAGVKALVEHSDCAFAFGDYRDIAYDGTVVLEPGRDPVQGGYYPALLRGNCIEMHATVLYRRTVFEEIGVFNTGLRACEDYDLYLRVTRRLPICHYDVQVAEYRQHDCNMSGDPRLMLRHVLSVLHSQKPYVKNNPTYKRAYRAGLRSFAAVFAVQLGWKGWAELHANHPARALGTFLFLARYYPLGVIRCLASFCTQRLRHFTITR